MAIITQTFFPLQNTPSSSTEIIPGLRWTYEKTDSGYSRTSSSGKDGLQKVYNFTLDKLPSGAKVNSITVEWFTTATRNSNKISGDYYGWNEGRVFSGTTTSGIEGTVSAYGDGAWGQGKLSIPNNSIGSCYNSSTRVLSCLFFYDISYPPRSPTTIPTGAGKEGSNNTYCYWWDIKVTVDYTPPYSTLTTPSVTTSTVTIGPSQKAVLSWGGSSSSGSNTITGYAIYKNGSQFDTVGEGVRSYDISYDNDLSDSERYYQVQAISSATDYNSALSNRLTVRYYKKLVMPSLKLYTNINNSQANTIYIGKKNQPTVTATWGSLSSFGGKYDSIANISLTNGESITSSDSSTILSEIKETTTYTLNIEMASGQSGSITATVSVLNNIRKAAFIPNLYEDGKTGPRINIEWEALEAIPGGNISYELKVENKENENYISQTVLGNSYSNLDITSCVENSEKYICSITPKVEASYGGYSLGQSDILSLKRAAKPVVVSADGETSYITFITDTKSPVYSWLKVKMDVTNNGYSSVTFKAGDKILKEHIFTGGETSSDYIHELDANYPNGAETEYKVIVRNSYGEEHIETKSIRRYKKPTITIENISQDAGETIHANFIVKDEYAASTSSGKCLIFMEYQGQQMSLTNDSLDCNLSSDITNKNYISGLLVSYTSIKEVLTKLAAELENFTVGKPAITFKIRAWNTEIWDEDISYEDGDAYPYDEVAYAEPVKIDYRREVTGLALSYNQSENKNYFSSNEEIEFNINANFQNIIGENVPDQLIYTITRGDNIVIQNNKERLGDISNDTQYTYKVIARTPYKDESTVFESESITINIYRYLAPTISVSNLILDEVKGLSGTINYTINGSSKIDNISNAIITFDGVYEEAGKEIILSDTAEAKTGSYETSFTAPGQTEQTTATFTITTTSTGGIEKTASYGPVLIKVMGVPFAIRKHGVGVHTPNDFNPSPQNAAFKVVGNADTSEIAEFDNNSNQKETRIGFNLTNSGISAKVFLALKLDENSNPYLAVIFPE